MHQRRSLVSALIAGAAIALALTGCNALFGRDVRLSDDAAVGGDARDAASTTPELCATPLPLCSQSAVPVAGDWDGNGTDTPGLFEDGRWCITNQLKMGDVCIEQTWGAPGDLPLVGDWDGDGVDTPGTYRDLRWYLNDADAAGKPADFSWGDPDIVPLAGDWDGLGHDSPGGAIEVAGTTAWTMTNHNAVSGNDHAFRWGSSNVTRLVGDWDGNGTHTPAWFRDGVWRFNNTHGDGPAMLGFRWGNIGYVPLVGDWDGDGVDTVGLYRDGEWQLSNEHINTLDGSDGPTAIITFRWGTDSSLLEQAAQAR